MKSVLISIKPKWCEKIISGEKTLEVRKTKPNLQTPFKCYIYCTKGRTIKGKTISGEEYELLYKGSGKVIGEFVCDKMFNIYGFSGSRVWLNEELLRDSCLSYQEIKDYAGMADEIYGLHISNLKIYDSPKSISEFWKAGKCPYTTDNGCEYPYHCFRAGRMERCGERIERPPQSWCFVDEL